MRAVIIAARTPRSRRGCLQDVARRTIAAMLFDSSRHEPLDGADAVWDEARARACIASIVSDTQARFRPGLGWPMHPLDGNAGDDLHAGNPSLYFGDSGVIWALRYLHSVGAARSEFASQPIDCAWLLQRTRDWLRDDADRERASFLMGETPVCLMEHAQSGSGAAADRLAELIAGNMRHPARELMWGSPGTLLAAVFMHERTGDERFAELYRQTAAILWSQLQWSESYGCHYWQQDLYGQTSAYMDAVHGFAGTALALIRGRHLLAPQEWERWQACIANSVRRSATLEESAAGGAPLANWSAVLLLDDASRQRWQANPRWLMQYCHGSPGFVINLADFPGEEIDDLLLRAGEATWAAGPLAKGSNLCHGTGGNGYAFLKLYERTGDAKWLQRARSFAMHGIGQTEAHAAQYKQLRYSLWTGDPGFAIFLWDCIREQGSFPTLDVF
jgi:hypothetical protein